MIERRILSTLAVGILGAALAAESSAQQVGEPFPRHEFPLLDEPDNLVDIEYFAGQKVLLVQFASW